MMQVSIAKEELDNLQERVRLLSDIALSALCLKLNIEHGFTPVLHALDRDLRAFRMRFGDLSEKGETRNGLCGDLQPGQGER
jgi:hypothetical protein